MPAVLVATGVAAALCFIASLITAGDPLAGLETAGILLVAWWAAVAGALARRTIRLSRALRPRGRATTIGGVACSVIPDTRCHAFTAGGLRPHVYITTTALDRLTEAELAAVLHHEAHHARTRAPLRAVAVEAWLHLLPLATGGRRRLSDRLVRIEMEADAHALRHGASRAQLASALLKFDDAAPGSAFSGAADARIRALLDGAPPVGSVPFEWVPTLLIGALLVGCRLAGTAMPF